MKIEIEIKRNFILYRCKCENDIVPPKINLVDVKSNSIFSVVI